LKEKREGNRFWQQLDPRIKLICIASLAVVVMLTPIHYYKKFLMFASLIILLGLLARVRFKHYMMRFVFLIPMFIFFGISLLIFSGKLPSHQLLILYNILVKALLTLSCFGILASTVAFPEIIDSLKALKFPGIFTLILDFAHRYVLLFQQEAYRLITARKSRTFSRQRTFKGLKSKAAVVPVFLFRVLDRSQRIYIAMLSRGFSDKIQLSTGKLPILSNRDYAVGVIFHLLLAVIVIWI